ncbi:MULTISPECIES: RNA polymerase sigma factor [Rhizobium]|uniref:RNA polymerase sigma factor n=1 Tax=Rhizobium rhododendri TaxID=2506430 RepID=A0ABY8IIM6_9HYPH|nr:MULTISPECIES: RNA polymerase sigma factor [Rhizobium]MBZ5760462.1 RNA polymerase sigma factor [Rhizobium sp. VS19-DR96]MBZ5766694.1 RNA polymerase sigma factor [Rhizobium sp. VS19-DR129.2]MBZ5773313.1 RNA polymerase sigma factor [Rhizobium sp. VS19-DRK62.2]MBZ5784297.1 RNA polymerase sigma factor [Rhizobium sp. VS19-DR121]MBZ5802657.1 RNA polymerase sigma factor [Rhizobium sp. VS19-DR181]
MSVAPLTFPPYGRVTVPAYSRTTAQSPAKPAARSTTLPAEDAIASEDDIRAGLSQHLKRLWRYAIVLSRQRDVADDLVQATCVRALERAGQYDPGTRLDRWLFAILHSIWLNEVRSRRVRMGQGFVEADEILVFDGAAQTETHLMAVQVMRKVQDLPEAQRTAVFLAYVEGLSYREVATVLDVPIGTVMSRLAAARAKLAENMAPSDGERRSNEERR